MTKDEALKLAHEALKKFHYAMIDAGVLDRQEVLNEGFTADTAIKEALAQPEQEPIGYLCENAVGHRYFRWKKPPSTYKPIALYTAPPQRTWVGLTDEEIAQGCKESWVTEQAWQSAVWWAEAKLKEKNT